MRKYLIAAVSLLLFVSGLVLSQDKTAVKEKPFILVNNNTIIPDGTATNGHYSEFAKACRAAGFEIDHQTGSHVVMRRALAQSRPGARPDAADHQERRPHPR